MYQIKDGFFYLDGKKIYPIGQSYYPSFHHAKYPVPPDGDRDYEMKKDLKAMADMGFNLVRFASLGETYLGSDGEVVVDTPFIDTMIGEADRNGMAVSIRIQGYSVNLRNFPDVSMISNHDEPQDPTRWSDFIQTTYFHEGILADNIAYTKAKAAHYAKFPNVVSTVTYNEPHLPGGGIFDYHPLAIQAYRNDLVKRGILTAEEAVTYEPPRTQKEQGPDKWALWREFLHSSLTDFLATAADAAREGSNLPTGTCLTDAALTAKSALRGTDYFGIAKVMDYVGYDCYEPSIGVTAYYANMLCDLAVSSAEAVGKNAWCIELDARTYIPPTIFNRNVFTTLGAGVKGILFYQWRGDYPAPGVPHPNSCGFLNYDGTPTNNYENGKRMVALLKRLSDYLVEARRIHTGLGLFHSVYASAYCDAVEYTDEPYDDVLHSLYAALQYKAYMDFRGESRLVMLTDASSLHENTCEIKTLIVPFAPYLSPVEKETIEMFIQKGGTVYEQVMERDCILGYKKHGVNMPLFDPFLRAKDICETLPAPVCAPDNRDALVQALDGDGWKLLTVTNLSPTNKPLSTVLTCNFPCRRATLYSVDGDRTLSVEHGAIIADNISDGCVILAEA